jgi:Ftsk gamma domain
MVEERRGFDWKLEGAGLVLFGAAAFLAVLSVMALVHELPREGAGGTTALAVIWTGILGALPGLVLALGAAAVGALLFLGRRAGAGRFLAGLAGCAAGLAIGAGAWRAGAGGIVGEAIGAIAARAVHPALAGLLALGVVGASAWFAWLRGMGFSGNPGRKTAVSVALDRKESVSAEEAAALVPEERRRPVLQRERAPAEPVPETAFPYPEDVRLKGRIPEGARPLATTHVQARQQDPSDVATVVRWTAPRRAAGSEPAGEDLAEGAAGVDPEDRDDAARTGRETRPPAEPVASTPLEREELEPAGEEPPATVARVEPEDLEQRPRVRSPIRPPIGADGQPVTTLEAASAPPRPSWEQPGLFEEDEEPVDAYGTPRSLVESLEAGDSGIEAAAVEEEGPEAELDAEDEHVAPDLAADHEDEEPEELYAADESEEAAEEEEDTDLADEEPEGVYAEDEDEDDAEDEEAAVAEADEVLVTAGAGGSEDPELSDRVLEPRPTPRSDLEKRVRLEGRSKLLYESGCLFLERGRVAVSLLQREYAMSFDEACGVLDELQEMGLIGPYLGGKHRDILLTSEEWLEKVSAP